MADTLVCSIELSKTAGVTVSVNKGQGQVVQTITMNGTSIVIAVTEGDKKTTITQDSAGIEHKVQGPADTSTVVQKADQVEITCKLFKVVAETVDVASSKDTAHRAQGTYGVSSQGDLSLGTQGALAASSARATTIAAQGAFEASAVGDAKMSGQNALVEGLVGTTVKGATSLDLKALQIVVAADAKLEASGPMTTVGKNLTTIAGQLIKVEGALVKLG
ncbi:MAG: hypothetical protein MUF34_20160 [Polyangiaceae bacterium]|jgi:hypothetical protein|nr:hypothetical protein [Polyangiaceae bacterium]